jgi:thiamine-phosphate pyrophosphorylase
MPLSRTRHLICLVTDRGRLARAAPGVHLVDLITGACRAGVDLIQIRERDLDARALTSLVKRCVAAAAGTSARIVVNERLDVALSAGAHGVHLRSDSIEAPRVREVSPAGFIIGRSVRGVEEAVAAERSGGLDYLILGTLFPTESKDPSHRLTTITGLAAACALVSIPVLAIGGITTARAEEIVKTGAAGIAAIGFFLPDPGTAVDQHLHARVSELRRVFDTCEAVP